MSIATIILLGFCTAEAKNNGTSQTAHARKIITYFVDCYIQFITFLYRIANNNVTGQTAHGRKIVKTYVDCYS